MTDFMEDIDVRDWDKIEDMIKVIGVGGAGCNAVSYMYHQGVKGCSFIVCNTDTQALEGSGVPLRIHLGHGRLGAGTDPVKGRNAALESENEIAQRVLENGTEMLFITAGLGGGTGTGAAPVIAKMAKERGILTVAVVTMPFESDGPDALTKAIDGLHSLEKLVDSLIVIKNEKLYEQYGDLLVHDAFPKSDEVLSTAVRSITEIISRPGHRNVDFEDIKALMHDSGFALMGCGTGTGENRIDDAIKQAFESPLLDDYDLKTARYVLVNITVSKNNKGLTMTQLKEVNARIKEYTGKAHNFKNGLVYDDDPEAGDRISITAIVTGLKYGDILPPGVEQGNYICINSDFVYDGTGQSGDDDGGISLPDSCTMQSLKIGFGKSKEVRTFRFHDDERPVLSIEIGQDRSELEQHSAMERLEKKQ